MLIAPKYFRHFLQNYNKYEQCAKNKTTLTEFLSVNTIISFLTFSKISQFINLEISIDSYGYFGSNSMYKGEKRGRHLQNIQLFLIVSNLDKLIYCLSSDKCSFKVLL